MTLLLAQLAVILLSARAVGWLFVRVGQPRVVGEMATGLLLGPTLFGALAPSAWSALFPTNAMGPLQTLSEIGLILFLFLVGLELDFGLLRGGTKAAMTAAAGAFAIPFALGVVLAGWLFASYAPAGITRVAFSLFIGVCTSATAFPVLARILKESGLLQTRLGVTALSAAAFNDVAAWIGLTAVVALVHSQSEATSLWRVFGGIAVYVAAMIWVVRPLAAKLFSPNGDTYSHDRLAVALAILLCSSMCTAWLGLHVSFGAFAAGAVMPRGVATRVLRSHLEDATLVLLLPLFFVLTGLRSDIRALYEPGMALTGVVVVVVATAAKLGGTWVGAAIGGVRGTDAKALGVLMNTRGLMELVILNIGLEIGVISRPLFTVFVLMALITTCMTLPLLRVLGIADKGPSRA